MKPDPKATQTARMLPTVMTCSQKGIVPFKTPLTWRDRFRILFNRVIVVAEITLITQHSPGLVHTSGQLVLISRKKVPAIKPPPEIVLKAKEDGP